MSKLVTQNRFGFYERARDPKLWKVNREALRLIGEFVVPSYYDTDCWQGYKVGKGKEDGRRD